MKALLGAFNQEKALVGAFFVIGKPVVEPMEHYTALILPNTVSLVQEFCVDVSAYQPVQWVEREDQECDTIFVKKCDWKKEVIIEIHPTVKS